MGIKQAQGEYLTSANTDDLFHDNALKIMADELDRTGAAICHSWLHRNMKGKFELWERPTGDYHRLRTRCFPGPMPMWRKSLHDKYGYFDESFKIVGDWEFWLRVMKAGEKICHIEQSLGVYLWREKSLERRDRQLNIAERERIKRMYR
jgi:hypothetical protein